MLFSSLGVHDRKKTLTSDGQWVVFLSFRSVEVFGRTSSRRRLSSLMRHGSNQLGLFLFGMKHHVNIL